MAQVMRLVFCIGAAILFFQAGSDMHSLRSEGGNSVAEFFYQTMGTFSYAMAALSIALGIPIGGSSGAARVGPTEMFSPAPIPQPDRPADVPSPPPANPAAELRVGDRVRISYKDKSRYSGVSGEIISVGSDRIVVHSGKSGKDVGVGFGNIDEYTILSDPSSGV